MDLKKKILVSLGVLFYLNSLWGQSSEPTFPSNEVIRQEIAEMELDTNWVGVFDLGDFSLEVNLTVGGPEKNLYIFYPSMHIPRDNEYWSLFFPVFKEVHNEEDAKRIMWALQNIDLNIKNQ